MLQVKSLVKRFGLRLGDEEVLKGITFSVMPQEVVGFLGPNGAGKTTTISIISGALNPTSGSVLIDGMDIVSHPLECKKIISIVPEKPWLWERLSAMEYLSFVGKIRAMSSEEFKARAIFLLKNFSLLDAADCLIESFSYGMKQKLVWCAALLVPPKLLLLDEPFTGLDPSAAKIARGFIDEITSDERYKTAVLVSTHNLSVAEKMCSRILLINKGQILADEDSESLKRKWLNAKNRCLGEGAAPSLLESVFFEIIEEKSSEMDVP